MLQEKSINFERIAKAIEYINSNFKEQPNLEQIAASVHLSPFHFQRLFKEWAGVSPKKFLQFISLEHAKALLRTQGHTLTETAFETGLSGTGRLHDLFIKIEGMTPGEYKNGGQELRINYSFANSLFGDLILASTTKGLCHIAFQQDKIQALIQLKKRFPNARYQEQKDSFQQKALTNFSNIPESEDVILHLKGTDFQLQVWQALLKIPSGRLSTYGDIALEIQKPRAVRAIGTAIGKNPVAYLIPCHRVIQSTGHFGQYRWGATRKTAMIGWESAQLHE